MPVYAWKIFLENAIEMVSIIPSSRANEAQTFRNHHHLAASHRTQWKHPVFISERLSCIHVWRTPFSVVPIHRTVHQKNESWIDGNSLTRKIQMCSCVKCTRVSGNLVYFLGCPHEWQKRSKYYLSKYICPCKVSSLPMFSLPNHLCCKTNRFDFEQSFACMVNA